MTDSTTAPSFGALLRRLRQQAGLTQVELAARSGISVRAISDLERGINRSARRDTVAMLADGLGLTGAARKAFAEAARRDAPSWDASRARRPVKVQSTSRLIGTEPAVQAAMEQLARPDVRLLTFVGPGGSGKTRLAVEVAARLRSALPDGTHVVPLASVLDPQFVPAAIAQVLGVREANDQTLRKRLVEYLRDKHLLVVLDNFEHVLAAAPVVQDLLATAAGLTFLVTSRATLKLPGEHRVTVAPNGIPDLVADPQGDHPHAIALFEENLAIERQLGDGHLIAETLDKLGAARHALGDLDAAGALFQESLAIKRLQGESVGIATTLFNLGRVAQARGDLPRATALHVESLALRHALETKDGIAASIEALAAIAAAGGDGTRAARLFGAADCLRQTIGAPVPPDDRAWHEQAVATARGLLGPAAFADAWSAGRGLSLDAAIDEALAGSPGPGSG